VLQHVGRIKDGLIVSIERLLLFTLQSTLFELDPQPADQMPGSRIAHCAIIFLHVKSPQTFNPKAGHVLCVRCSVFILPQSG